MKKPVIVDSRLDISYMEHNKKYYVFHYNRYDDPRIFSL